MQAKDFDPLFIAPAFLFLCVLCFAITLLSIVGAFTISPGYIVLAFIFFLLGYISGRIGMEKSKTRLGSGFF
jgi:hypothetical protein